MLLIGTTQLQCYWYLLPVQGRVPDYSPLFVVSLSDEVHVKGRRTTNSRLQGCKASRIPCKHSSDG